MDCLWFKEARQDMELTRDDEQDTPETLSPRRQMTKHVDFDFDEARDAWWIKPTEENPAIANRPPTPYADATMETERRSRRRSTISLRPSSRPLRAAPSPNRYEAYEARRDPMDILSQQAMPDNAFPRPIAPKHMNATCFTSEITGQEAAEVIADRAGHSNARFPRASVSTTTPKTATEPVKAPVLAPFSLASIKESRALKQELNDADTSPARKLSIEERFMQKACWITEHFKTEGIGCQPPEPESSDLARDVPSNVTTSPAYRTLKELALFHQKSEIGVLNSVQQGKDAGQTGRKSYIQRLRQSLAPAQAWYEELDDQARSRNEDRASPVVASPTPIKPAPTLAFTPVGPAISKEVAVNAELHGSKEAQARRSEKFRYVPRTSEAQSEAETFAEAFGRKLDSVLWQAFTNNIREGFTNTLKETNAPQQSPAADRTYAIEDLPLRPKNTVVSSDASSLPTEAQIHGELKDPAQPPPTALSPSERRYRDRKILLRYLRNKIPESRDGLARLTDNKSFAEIEKIEEDIQAHFEKTTPGSMEKLRAWDKRERTKWRMNKWVEDNPELQKSAGGQSKGEKDGKTEHGVSGDVKAQLEEAAKPKVQEKDNESEKVHIEDVGKYTGLPYTPVSPANPIMPYRSPQEPSSSQAAFSRPSTSMQPARSTISHRSPFAAPLNKFATPETTKLNTPTPVKPTTPTTAPERLADHPDLSESIRRTLEQRSRVRAESRKAVAERELQDRLTETGCMLAKYAEERKRQEVREALMWTEDARAWEDEQRQEKERIKKMEKQGEDKATTSTRPTSAANSKLPISTSSPRKTTPRFDTSGLGSSVEPTPATPTPTPITVPPMLGRRDRITRSSSSSLYTNVDEPLQTASPGAAFETVPLSTPSSSSPTDEDWDKIEDFSSSAADAGWELLSSPAPRRFFNWMNWK